MLGRLDNGFPRSSEMQARIRRPPSTYLNQVWLDMIAFSPAFLRGLISLLGADRFVVGSDYPVGGPPHPVLEVQRLELALTEESAVLRTNATALLELV